MLSIVVGICDHSCVNRATMLRFLSKSLGISGTVGENCFLQSPASIGAPGNSSPIIAHYYNCGIKALYLPRIVT